MRLVEKIEPARTRRAQGSGFVETDQVHEPGIFVRQRYVLKSAAANTSYDVRLFVHLFDPTCSSAPVLFASTRLETDEKGDGSVEIVVRPEDVPSAVRNATHGVHWEVMQGQELVYRTACTAVTLD